MSHLQQHSNEFILNQLQYYTKHLGCGNFHDRNMIVGLKQQFEGEALRRGLLRYDPIKGRNVLC